MLHRLSVPVISDDAIEHLLRMLKVDRIDKDTTLFEIGYRQCKEDITNMLIKDCLADTATGAEELLRQVRRHSND